MFGESEGKKKKCDYGNIGIKKHFKKEFFNSSLGLGDVDPHYLVPVVVADVDVNAIMTTGTKVHSATDSDCLLIRIHWRCY